jgi:formate dehydrogenase (NADP+) beta subunit
MDVVRCAIRANAKKVVMLYRRDEATIIKNTTYEEYHEAVEEGVEFIFHSAVAAMRDENDVLKSLIVDRFELGS